MTGGSLGQRTGSYGSLLQQQQQQLQLESNSFVLPIQTTTTTGFARKPSKMLLSSSREKERFLLRICKFACRRRVGMLLLVAVSVVVFMSVLSAVSKEDDRVEVAVVDSHHRSTLHVQDNIHVESTFSNYPESSVAIVKVDEKHAYDDRNKDNSSSLPSLLPVKVENDAQPFPSAVISGAIRPGHPCEKFSLPPPPADKKRTGPRPCPVCYLPVEQAIASMPSAPSESPLLRNLTYVYEENSVTTEPFGGSDFGGYPSLKQRNDSFDIKESMNVHCGFVRGTKPGHQTGFDIDDADLLEMEQCHGIVVASAIFGNYDIIQQPKNISEAAKKNVCFYMFVDEETEAYMRNSSVLDEKMKVGLWRIILVHNLPYTDARRNGKVPKLLLHRIFPNARYSIWIDGKLELVVDPYKILERFLWRNGATFAISRHYRRFDVFQEAEANKAAGKYENASIDFQVEFYKNEGLTPYSEVKLPITSDVPEGCVIIREHIPITNLFTCLWFNEVDRFTSRDQISFAIVRDKIMAKVNWGINMFMDCERRNFVVQAYHRDLLEHMAPPIAPGDLHPSTLLDELPPVKSSAETIITDKAAKVVVRRIPTKRGRERRSGSRRHRKTSAGSRETNSI